MGKLDGKVAVVTGASAGIGFAAAKRLAAEGAFVFITGRRRRELDEAAAAIGGDVTALQGDVSNLADLDRVFAAVKAIEGAHRCAVRQRRESPRARRSATSARTSSTGCSAST